MGVSEGIQENEAVLHWSDYVIIAAYFVIIIGVGFWVKNSIMIFNYKYCIMYNDWQISYYFLSKSSRKNENTVAGYFLANRSMNWLIVCY